METIVPDDQIIPVRRDTFVRQLANSMAIDPRLAANLTEPAELPDGIFYLSADGKSGFGVTGDDELVALHSLVQGRCHALVDQAIAIGARYLNCFDGHLPAIYARHGFTDNYREPNWTPGGPDVVYMVHQSVIDALEAGR